MSTSSSLTRAVSSREIVREIFRQLTQSSDILALGQVSRAFRAGSQQRLYSIVSFEDAEDCRNFHRLVECVPSIAPFVRILNISGQFDDEDSWSDLPSTLRGFTKLARICVVSVMWSSSHHGIGVHSRLKSIRCHTILFDSVQSMWDMLYRSSTSLESVDMGNVTFRSHNLVATPLADAVEPRLNTITLDVQTEEDVDMINVLFDPSQSPLRLEAVETLYINEIAVQQSQKLPTAIQTLCNALPALAAITFGDAHGIEGVLPPLNVKNISEFSFVVTLTDASRVSPSLAWWTKNFNRSRPEWERVTITLQLQTGSSSPLHSLFPDSFQTAWARLDIALSLRPGEADASVTLLIQLDSEHNSEQDFMFMRNWFHKRLTMLQSRRLLYVLWDQSAIEE